MLLLGSFPWSFLAISAHTCLDLILSDLTIIKLLIWSVPSKTLNAHPLFFWPAPNYMIYLINGFNPNGSSHQWWLAFCLKEIYLFFIFFLFNDFPFLSNWSQSSFRGMGISWLLEQLICPRLHCRLLFLEGTTRVFLFLGLCLVELNIVSKTKKKYIAYLYMLYTCKFIKLIFFYS